MVNNVNFTVKNPRIGMAYNQYCGRNGYGKCDGLVIDTLDSSVRIYPITSKGVWSDACFIEIPILDVEAFIEATRNQVKVSGITPAILVG